MVKAIDFAVVLKHETCAAITAASLLQSKKKNYEYRSCVLTIKKNNN